MRKVRIKERKFSKVGIVTTCLLICIYLGMSVYFKNHFYFGTVINHVNVSGKTVDGAENKIADEFDRYSLELIERNNEKEEIRSSDINLKYSFGSEIREIKDRQNPFVWIFAPFSKRDSITAKIISYDEEMLLKYFNNLNCFTSSTIIEPRSPVLEYTECGYMVIEEIYGNKVIKDTLDNLVKDSIVSGKRTIDLDLMNCYENPKYYADSEEVTEAKNILDKYILSKVIYTFGDLKETLDGSTINTWFKVSEDFKVILDDTEVKKYLNKLSKTYSTYGKTRNFKTSVGKIVEVSGGNYGWLIDRAKEEEALILDIKEGKTITREPIYLQTAVSHDENDIGNTYVEINMTRQYLWFYVNGSLLTAGEVVTGNVSNNNSTPVGTFRLNYKQKDAVLKGENYRSSVNFWMPFYGNVGIHDASWRGSFGGDIYKTNGSHGCINTPYYLASTIFNYIEEGTPIICYYE